MFGYRVLWRRWQTTASPWKGNINKYVSKTSDEDKKKIDLTVAKFFYACNISINVLKSYAFHNFIVILRPSYRLPLHKELAGSLLDSIHTEIEESVKENLKGREGTLQWYYSNCWEKKA